MKYKYVAVTDILASKLQVRLRPTAKRMPVKHAEGQPIFPYFSGKGY